MSDKEGHVKKLNQSHKEKYMPDIPVGTHVLVICSYLNCQEGILHKVCDNGIMVYNTKNEKAGLVFIEYRSITAQVLTVDTYVDRVLQHRNIIPEDCNCYDTVCITTPYEDYVGTIEKMNFDNIVLIVDCDRIAIPVVQITGMWKR